MGLRTAVAMGDSITLGVGDDGRGATSDRGWAAHVARALRSDGFVNLAKIGTRARDLADDQVPRALALRPELVLMSIGGNDVLRGDFSPWEVEGSTGDAIRTLAPPVPRSSSSPSPPSGSSDTSLRASRP